MGVNAPVHRAHVVNNFKDEIAITSRECPAHVQFPDCITIENTGESCKNSSASIREKNDFLHAILGVLGSRSSRIIPGNVS